MNWYTRTLSLLIVPAFALAALLSTGCERETETELETEPEVVEAEPTGEPGVAEGFGGEEVEAEEIAEGEGVAEPGAEADIEPDEADELLDLDNEVFGQFDVDRTGTLTEEEFTRGWETVNVLGAFDVNEDAAVQETEFYASMFDAWDKDDDGSIMPTEYVSNAKQWFPEDTEELEDFEDIDSNEDGLLTRGEFITEMDDVALYDQWDLDDDAEISRDELSKVLRKVWNVGSTPTGS